MCFIFHLKPPLEYRYHNRIISRLCLFTGYHVSLNSKAWNKSLLALTVVLRVALVIGINCCFEGGISTVGLCHNGNQFSI